MSLRRQAKILGVDAGHLSRMVNGKRPWKPELKARYEALIGNTFGNTTQMATQHRWRHYQGTPWLLVTTIFKGREL